MALKYDYDIHRPRSQEACGDAQTGDLFDETAPGRTPCGKYVALFRDPATVEALRGTDPEVQAYFTASGFGLTTYDSGAPCGYFPAQDLAARNDVTERLTENLSKFDLKGKDTNGISFGDFLAYEVAAKPIDIDAIAARANVSPKPKAEAEAVEGPEHCKLTMTINPLVLAFVVFTIILMPYVTEGVSQL